MPWPEFKREETDVEIALWIADFNASHGYSPTLREAQEHFGWKSVSTAHVRFEALQHIGMIRVSNPLRRRAIEVSEDVIQARYDVGRDSSNDNDQHHLRAG